MLKEFGTERLIGMLHAFVLLKPVLSKALRDKEEAIVREADLAKFERLKESIPGFPTDSNEVQDRLDELQENVEETCSAFNRTLQALQRKLQD